MTTVTVRGKPVKLEHVADLKPTGRIGKRGPSYSVSLNGEELARSTIAEFDACRVLEARGMTGKIGFRNADGMIGLVTSIEAGAKLTVTETGGRPRFGKWQPFTRF
jgi:hypothetical protein